MPTPKQERDEQLAKDDDARRQRIRDTLTKLAALNGGNLDLVKILGLVVLLHELALVAAARLDADDGGL